MSIHLLVVASYLPKEEITQSQKLALQKLADSADDETRMSRPGLARLAAWVGVNEKRVITVVTELVAKGLVERVQTGKAGRAAVYRVFPKGIPPIPSTAELKARLESQRAAPKNPAKARPGVKRAAPAKPAMTAQDVVDRVKDKAQAPQENPPEAGFHEGNPRGGEGQVPPVEPGEFQAGNPDGSTGGTPSFLGSSSVLPFPPTPAAVAAREPSGDVGTTDQQAAPRKSGCSKHAGNPASSCRACGTNPRAERKRQQAQERDAERRANDDHWDQWHRDADERRRRADLAAGTVLEARSAARSAVRNWKDAAREEVPPQGRKSHRNVDTPTDAYKIEEAGEGFGSMKAP
ncbi:helix-turn-helix domain-containing protein [Streptomyces kutzneri]|uniref:helix-turn-helix domain-containing protein n=1 Tax=Streptomyces kutzneri TaxID=3051179 RepID=UPI0028D6FFDC|nr:helix-turn-helix domain-containing protein [Streptomyces sp. DSM 40907]